MRDRNKITTQVHGMFQWLLTIFSRWETVLEQAHGFVVSICHIALCMIVHISCNNQNSPQNISSGGKKTGPNTLICSTSNSSYNPLRGLSHSVIEFQNALSPYQRAWPNFLYSTAGIFVVNFYIKRNVYKHAQVFA